MSRVSLFSAPFLLGFDTYEERIDRLSRAADGYPPYNIERTVEDDGTDHFLISIAVAGFARSELEIMGSTLPSKRRGRAASADHDAFATPGQPSRARSVPSRVNPLTRRSKNG